MLIKLLTFNVLTFAAQDAFVAINYAFDMFRPKPIRGDQCPRESEFSVQRYTTSRALEPYDTVAQKYVLVEKLKDIPESAPLMFLPLPEQNSIPFPTDDEILPIHNSIMTRFFPSHDVDSFTSPEKRYKKFKRFAQGHYGEVWLAQDIHSGPLDPDDIFAAKYVLKRIFNSSEREFRLSGEREIYFGTLFRGKSYIARFIESFEIGDDLWLVFRNEGLSLYNVLYDKKDNGFVVSSDKWNWLRTSKDGQDLMKQIIESVLKGLSTIHSKNVTHRDLKPSNILVGSKSSPHISICDFGSSIDEYSLKYLYDDDPNQTEETLDYAPPEVLFGNKPYDEENPHTYDLWSMGVMILEMILGTSVVFEIDGRSKAILERNLIHKTAAQRQRAYFFQALAEYCFYRTFNSPCPVEKTMKAIRRRDPLNNFDDKWLVLLLRRLLEFSPVTRISAKMALTHAYFLGPQICPHCGKSFEFKHEVEEHIPECEQESLYY